MNVLGRMFLKSRKDRRKGGVFFMRCRRTYILNNTVGVNDIGEPIMLNKFGAIAILTFLLSSILKNYCSKSSSLPS